MLSAEWGEQGNLLIAHFPRPEYANRKRCNSWFANISCVRQCDAVDLPFVYCLLHISNLIIWHEISAWLMCVCASMCWWISPRLYTGGLKSCPSWKFQPKRQDDSKWTIKNLWPEKSYPRLNYYSQNDESCTNNQRLQAKCSSIHPHKKPWHRRRSKRSGAYM